MNLKMIPAVCGIAFAAQSFAAPKDAGPALPGKEPMPCTVSFVAIGNAPPPRYLSPKDFLKQFGGQSETMDNSCKALIAGGQNVPVLVPVQENEKPPGPLKVYLNPRDRVYQSFSLILGGVSTRIPYPRGNPLQIYQQNPIPAESEKQVAVGYRSIKSIPIPEQTDHMMVVFLNRPKTFVWKDHKIGILDISPKKLPAGSVVVINASSKDIVLHTGEGGRPLMIRGAAIVAHKPSAKFMSGSDSRYRYALAGAPQKIVGSVIARNRPDHISLFYFLDELRPVTEAGICAHSIPIRNATLGVPEILKMREKGFREAEGE